MGKYAISAVAVSFLCLAFVASPASAQADKSKRPSPPAKAECKLSDGKTITVDYSSPRMRGRKIMGDLVPFGRVWRVGANEATSFVTNADLTVGDKTVPAGKYTMFAIPDADRWTLIISKTTGEWGLEYSGAEMDLMRTDMKVSSLSAPLENFTIGFDQTSAGCTMHFDWETTRASVAITPKK